MGSFLLFLVGPAVSVGLLIWTEEKLRKARNENVRLRAELGQVRVLLREAVAWREAADRQMRQASQATRKPLVVEVPESAPVAPKVEGPVFWDHLVGEE